MSGFFDKAKEVLTGAKQEHGDKVTDAVDQHGDKINDGIERAGDYVDERTGGKYAEHVDTAQDFARDRLGTDAGVEPGTEAATAPGTETPAADAQRPAVETDPAGNA